MPKTASDLKRTGWPSNEMEKYRPWKAVERHSKNSELKARRGFALEISRKSADMLKEKYGATRVILFGSLAHMAWFTPRSDIDIYAEGIPVHAFFKAEADVQEIGLGFKVDLVDPEECSQEMLKRIEQEGVEL